jgi:hypothetical protein
MAGPYKQMVFKEYVKYTGMSICLLLTNILNEKNTSSSEPWKVFFPSSTPHPAPSLYPAWRHPIGPHQVPIFPHSHWLPSLSPLLPCLVTSAPEDGDSTFRRKVSIGLQIHMAPKPKTSITKWVKHVYIYQNLISIFFGVIFGTYLSTIHYNH